MVIETRGIQILAEKVRYGICFSLHESVSVKTMSGFFYGYEVILSSILTFVLGFLIGMMTTLYLTNKIFDRLMKHVEQEDKEKSR